MIFTIFDNLKDIRHGRFYGTRIILFLPRVESKYFAFIM